MSDDYAERAARFSLTSKEEIKELAKDPSVKFLDVRSQGELDTKSLTGYPFVHAQCTMGDTSQLSANASKILPDKDAPVIVFCGIGGRAVGAKNILESMGYTKVFNAGGLKDLE